MEKWYAIKINNNTHKRIYVSAGCGRYGIPDYPDTLLPSKEPSLLNIEPHDYNNLRSSIEWESIILRMEYDTLSIYFFDADTIDANTWNEIKRGYKIIKRKDLSLDDLRQTNWTIDYP
ncbi:MAG TPA: hypothetical protein VK179_18115 [Bacteroidales bacterium]|nr:hypothetical protein [Bacteroidales bacterium]